MRYTKVNNQLIEKYTSLKITSTLPASGEDKEIVLVKGHGVYQYRTNTWVKVLNLEADVSSGFIGEIRPTIEATLGAEWLECDGSSYNTSTYPDLYALLGTATLPDLRECVLYGCGTNGTNPLKQYTLFGVSAKTIMNHTHSFSFEHNHGVPSEIRNHTHTDCTYALCGGGAQGFQGSGSGSSWYAEMGNGVLFIYDDSVSNITFPRIFFGFADNSTTDGSHATLSSSIPAKEAGSISFNQISTSATYGSYGSGVPRPNEFGVKYKIRAKI